MAQKILIVDDEPTQRRILEEVIKRFGYEVLSAENGEQALDVLAGPDGEAITLMLLDLVMPGMGGMDVLSEMQSRKIELPVIVQTANGSIEAVVDAMRAGADDFVVKPVSPERLQVSIKNALKLKSLSGEITRLKKQNNGTLTFDDMIASSQAMANVKRLGQRGAASTIPILIEGQSGVGKEVIARAIQGESERRGKPFVTVNCGAIPENLVESILFGHEKGSFTGANDKHVGKFAEADGGTLFLDEVGELPLDVQVKLLRVLQEGEVDPIGSKRPVKVDVRIISATNRDMIEMVKGGSFREDLYYRLNVFPINIPPLKERKSEIAALIQHFMARFSAEEGRKINGVCPQALEMLSAYDWPGNVRQLENVIFRAVILCEGDVLNVSDFPQIAALISGYDAEIPPAPLPEPDAHIHEGPAMIGGNFPEVSTGAASTSGSAMGIPIMGEGGHMRALHDVESDMIRLAMERYRGHMSEVARQLGIGRSTLYRKVRDLGLEV